MTKSEKTLVPTGHAVPRAPPLDRRSVGARSRGPREAENARETGHVGANNCYPAVPRRVTLLLVSVGPRT